MKVAVIGAGIVGVSLALRLLSYDKNISVDLYDSFSIPSKGTSVRNSGVLHAGLYYTPGTLKSKLCYQGRTLLEEYILKNSLPILKCGKLLVPHLERDKDRLKAIKQKADSNGCETFLVDYDFARHIQPGISKRSVYLWSPKTCVFSPEIVLDQMVSDLSKSERVGFINETIDFIDPCTTTVISNSSIKRSYDFIYNVAGPGALRIFKQISDSLDNIRLIPFIGEYARLSIGPEIKTNLYPVPDPDLPFLGVHITPRANASKPIIGPNALPYHKSYLDEYLASDLTHLPTRLSLLFSMFLGNKANFRDHALSEFSISKRKKFYEETKLFFDEFTETNVEIKMDNSVYGIRPQLVDIRKLNFVNDFLLERTNNVVHVVNAVSPAFTSSLSLGDYLCKMM